MTAFNESLTLQTYRVYHRFWIRIWVICAIVVTFMSSWLGYIGAMPDEYNDYTSNWESCLFQPNYAYVPSATGPKLQKVGEFISALSFVGIVVIGMTLMGNCALYWSWSSTKWCFPAGFFGLWCSLMVRFLSLHAHCYLSLNCFCRDLRTTPLLRRFPPRRRPTQLCLYLCTGS